MNFNDEHVNRHIVAIEGRFKGTGGRLVLPCKSGSDYIEIVTETGLRYSDFYGNWTLATRKVVYEPIVQPLEPGDINYMDPHGRKLTEEEWVERAKSRDNNV